MTDDPGPTADLFFEANEGWGAGALAGTTWVLTALDDGPIALEPGPTISFGAEDTVAGSAGCNRYRGQAIHGDGTVSVGQLALKRMLCPAPMMALESAFLAGLEHADGWRRDGDPGADGRQPPRGARCAAGAPRRRGLILGSGCQPRPSRAIARSRNSTFAGRSARRRMK